MIFTRSLTQKELRQTSEGSTRTPGWFGGEGPSLQRSAQLEHAAKLAAVSELEHYNEVLETVMAVWLKAAGLGRCDNTLLICQEEEANFR